MVMWVSNVPRNNIVSNGEPAAESPVPLMASAYYDSSVEVLSIRFRNGEAKYIIEGGGWDGNYGEVVNTLRKAGVEIW